MFKRIGLFGLVMLLILLSAACGREGTAIPTAIYVDPDTVPERIDIDAFAWEIIVLVVTMSDGTYKTVHLDETMIDMEDRLKLETTGQHEITIRYEGLSTRLTLVLTENDFFTQLLAVYRLGHDAGLIDGTYDEWLEEIRGEDGREIILNVSETHIQWKYEGDSLWNDLVSLVELMGEAGVDGMSAYDIYKTHHPGYDGDELAWLEQLIDGTLPFAPAESFPFTFEVVDDTFAVITSFTGTEASIHIPTNIAGYDVTAIAAFAFSGVESVERVVVSESVTAIGDGAFSGMASLQSLHIPDSVVEMGEGIVSGSPALEIFSMHAHQPDGWHPAWNPTGYPVAWFIELEYHGLYADLFATQTFKVHNYGIGSDGVAFEAYFQVYHDAYFLDYLPPSYLSFDERTTWYLVKTVEDFHTPPFFDRYDYDAENGCYFDASPVDSGVFAGYHDFFMQMREQFYVPSLNDDWFERTITGFALKDEYLGAIPDIYIPGDIYAYEIHFVEGGFGIYLHAWFPGHDAATEGWLVFTDIGVVDDVPEFIPCEP